MEEKDRISLIEEIKAELEELEKQLKQSGEDVKSTYQERKKKIAGILKQYTQQLEASGSERLKEVKEDSKELIDLLEANYDISYTDYAEESGRISTAVDSLKEKIKKMGEEAEKLKGQISGDVTETLEKFKTELDIQKAHFKATKERTLKEYEEWKRNRLEEVTKLKEKLEKEMANSKLEAFTDELSKSYDHLKQAFKNLW